MAAWQLDLTIRMVLADKSRRSRPRFPAVSGFSVMIKSGAESARHVPVPTYCLSRKKDATGWELLTPCRSVWTERSR